MKAESYFLFFKIIFNICNGKEIRRKWSD